MSASRSVAAAQRRRAGPLEPQQAIRGPNTSINSSQVFSQPQQNIQSSQMRAGTTGRLAGQQAAIQQQQYLQQQPQLQQQNTQSKNNQMTVPQAITLITLRLGKIENQLAGSELNPLNNGSLENALIESILQRLDSLEQNQNENNDVVGSSVINTNLEEEIIKIKQQLETCKLGVTSLRSTTTVSNKDLKAFKSELDALKIEFFHTKNLLEDLQVVYDNKNESLLDVDYAPHNDSLSSRLNFQNDLDNIVEEESTYIVDSTDNEVVTVENQENMELSNDKLLLEPESNIVNELITEPEPSSLKEIIQQELKQSGVFINENVNLPNNVTNNKKQGKYNKNNK